MGCNGPDHHVNSTLRQQGNVQFSEQSSELNNLLHATSIHIHCSALHLKMGFVIEDYCRTGSFSWQEGHRDTLNSNAHLQWLFVKTTEHYE